MMNIKRNVLLSGALALSLVGGCADNSGRGFDGPGVEVAAAALSLVGVGDVVWDIQVMNAATGEYNGGEVVWEQRISSSRYGDGVGSASYIGPCDASSDANEDGFNNTVNVWVVGIYENPVDTANLDAFGEAPPPGFLAFQNPTATYTQEGGEPAAFVEWSAPLSRQVFCEENADAFVQFDVTIMRPAQQGFFDIAVNFNNIYCSAKFDCKYGEADIELLHNGLGERAKTFVLGFACTGGLGDASTTELYLDNLVWKCGEDAATVFDVSALVGDGNQCTPSTATEGGELVSAGMTCPEGVLSGTITTPDFFQFAIYQGAEQLQTGGLNANKLYWNIALGINRANLAGCTLTTKGTADDSSNSLDNVNNGAIAVGTVYPYIVWDVDAAECTQHPVAFGDENAMVYTTYTTTATGEGLEPLEFDNSYEAEQPYTPL